VAAGKEISTVECIDAKPFAGAIKTQELNVLDVRRQGEYGSAHLESSVNLPLDYLNSTMDQVDKDTTYHVHCAGGYRSMIFISILQARGYEKLINVNGGWGAISVELPQEEIVTS
jgi:rhodanese-related sulfurtransferase